MDTSRRSFLKMGGLTLAALPFANSLLSGLTTSEAHAAAPALPECKETDPMAKSLKYIPHADKAPKGNPRAAKDKAGQYCNNCQLYTKGSGEKEKEVGKCLVIPKCQVHAIGWCQSWVKKPG